MLTIPFAWISSPQDFSWLSSLVSALTSPPRKVCLLHKINIVPHPYIMLYSSSESFSQAEITLSLDIFTDSPPVEGKVLKLGLLKFCSKLYSQCLDQYLVHNRLSIHISWVNLYVYLNYKKKHGQSFQFFSAQDIFFSHNMGQQVLWPTLPTSLKSILSCPPIPIFPTIFFSIPFPERS